MTETIVTGVETLAEGFTLTEGPRWRDGRLYFSDMYGHRVCSLGEDGLLQTVMSFDDEPSGLGFLPDGDMLVVLMGGAKIVRLSKGGVAPHADLGDFAGGFGINDMIVGPSGRAYVSQIGFDYKAGAPRRATALVTVDPSGVAEIAASDLWTPNGIALTPDGRTLIVAETGTCRLTAFDVDAAGQLSKRRTFASLPGLMPDGICLDDEGGVWVGVPMNDDAANTPGPGFLRVEEGGRVTHRIPPPEGRRAVACVFGGADRGELYLCTVGPSVAGRIERVRTPFSGAGIP